MLTLPSALEAHSVFGPYDFWAQPAVILSGRAHTLGLLSVWIVGSAAVVLMPERSSQRSSPPRPPEYNGGVKQASNHKCLVRIAAISWSPFQIPIACRLAVRNTASRTVGRRGRFSHRAATEDPGDDRHPRYVPHLRRRAYQCSSLRRS